MTKTKCASSYNILIDNHHLIFTSCILRFRHKLFLVGVRHQAITLRTSNVITNDCAPFLNILVIETQSGSGLIVDFENVVLEVIIFLLPFGGMIVQEAELFVLLRFCRLTSPLARYLESLCSLLGIALIVRVPTRG